MANALTVNPLYFDTTTGVKTGPLVIEAIYWTGCTTAGHTCVLHDAASGNVVWSSISVANTPQGIYLGGLMVKGLYLTTLGSGVVLVYLK